MLRIVLTLCSVLCLTGKFCSGVRPHQKYEDYFFYTTYNGSKVTWMMMPDDNGLVVSAVIAGLDPKQVEATDHLNFFLWTRHNRLNPESSQFHPEKILKFKHFHPKKRTVVLIHGFTESFKEPEFFNTMTEALLDQYDYNIIGINWIALASIPWYGQGVKNSHFVGLVTAKIIDGIRKVYTGEQEFHIIAYNLGTLVAGVAGANVKYKKVERITGLDPPHILTKNLPKSKKLDKSDADVVEIVHTSGDYIGINEPVGHRDFYPNGGKWPQPGCLYDIADRCSPRRAFKYYAEAISQKHGALGIKCDNFKDFREGRCHGHTTIHLWNNASSHIQGRFYFLTNSEEPFWPLDPY